MILEFHFSHKMTISQQVTPRNILLITPLKVWQVKVDLHVLDNGGNIVDCASIAAITALAHFRY